ncbi:hybrid sensor histidine kinase/response regulator [Alsobacter soli]|uniref:Chemotaxis protein CheA n=1 Tax=Alsobacter soli TaxID=2109933 RepID=A0A2T1HZ75_9HYPH|nr:chemotaxis protein CheW [Alsobacter soli]PSC06914.1 hybrid sensor histidine kinase/response regulator [Alsobacter soli]
MDDVLREFLTETFETVENVDRQLVQFEREPNNATMLAHIFRLVHTIKGTCGFLGLPRLEALSHAAESLISRFREGAPVTTEAVTLILSTIDRIKMILKVLEETQAEPEGGDADLIAELTAQADGRVQEHAPEPARPTPLPPLPRPEAPAAAPPRVQQPAPQAEPDEPPRARQASPARPAPARNGAQGTGIAQSIRVGLDTLEGLMTMVSELVLTRNQLVELARHDENSAFKAPLQRLSSVTAELQERVMKTRMQPISTAWQKLPRLVRDLCAELGKDIELILTGADTELDRQVLELVKDPFTHLIRNAADHAIETPEERRRAGKPPRGSIRISAAHESGTITIEVADDGRGLDVARVAAKALERGLVTPAELERMSDERIARFIFEPGFTTIDHVSHVSGRGVGMDVVRANIELIGGSVDIRWTPGQGSTFTMKIPLTLAIVAALIIESGGHRFAIPQVAVVELVQPRGSSEHRLESINGASLLRLRDTLLPVVRLSSILGFDKPGQRLDPEDGFVVVLKLGKRSFGLMVDKVFHTEEIVVKPISNILKPINIFSGNTILGDGRVILILDPNGVVQRIGPSPAASRQEREDMAPRRRVQEDKSSFLVFRAGEGELKAVPLAAVTRLEEFEVSKIEAIGGRIVAQYRGDLIPIVPAVPGAPLHESGIQPVLVFSEGDRTAGIAVDEIVDIVEDHLEIKSTGQAPGVIGSAVIRSRATEIIDVAHFLRQAHPDWFETPAQPSRARSNRVLLVDGAPFFRGMLAPALKAAGYDVVALAEFDAALTVLQRSAESFAVVVADIESRGRNGFDLVEGLQVDSRTADLPVIGMASRLQPAALERARALGVFDVVAKFDRNGLIEAIGEAIQQREAEAA